MLLLLLGREKVGRGRALLLLLSVLLLLLLLRLLPMLHLLQLLLNLLMEGEGEVTREGMDAGEMGAWLGVTAQVGLESGPIAGVALAR